MINTSFLNSVREPLLQEAKGSPNLLSDLAGLEKYVAESYSSRSFIELLQNADDAKSSRMLVKRLNKHIIVANDGNAFTAHDFESLCRSAASKKERKTSIGFRGIGFKSVVGFAKQVHLISGKLETTFSRELTAKIIPEAPLVPLIRIPHPIDSTVRVELSQEIEDLFNNGYNSIFIFSHLIADFVENEFQSLDPTSILFLRNVQNVFLESASPITFSAKRTEIDENSYTVELLNNTAKQKWTVFKENELSIAVQKVKNKYVKLSEKDAVVHAFLPTIEQTGFGFKINGDITTDPSRLRVILDANTLDTINKVATLYIQLLKKCLAPKSKFGAENLLECLLPLFDIKVISYQKVSFQKQLFAAIIEQGKCEFTDFLRKPSWLNPVDSEILAIKSNIRLPSRDIAEIEGLDSLLKSFGLKEISLEMLSNSLKGTQLTLQGASEVVSHLTKLSSTKQISPHDIDNDWKIWSVDKHIHSLSDVIKTNKKLDIEFIDMVSEKVGISSELPRMIKSLTNDKIVKVLIPSQVNKSDEVQEADDDKGENSFPCKRISLVKWRSAEQQVLEILNSDGWTAKDVSKQNIGYDIECVKPNNETLFVEVKSLKYAGQDFTLTSNEEATAREKGEAYMIALVIQKQDQLHVMFVESPLKVLQFERQCKQWAWVCSSYNFIPRLYEFKN